MSEDDSYLKTGGVKPVKYTPPKKPFVFTKDEPDDAESQKKALYLEGYGRQFGEKMTYSIGLSYGLAVGTGGLYGALMGLKKPATNNKLRLNAVLNGAGSKGPVLANQAAVITMYVFFLDCVLLLDLYPVVSSNFDVLALNHFTSGLTRAKILAIFHANEGHLLLINFFADHQQ